MPKKIDLLTNTRIQLLQTKRDLIESDIWILGIAKEILIRNEEWNSSEEVGRSLDLLENRRREICTELDNEFGNV